MRLTQSVCAAALLALVSCKAKEGERCICADDCRDGLVCLAAGRVLRDGECSPAVGSGAEPGECLDQDAAGLGDDGFPEPELYMDLGSKRDFDPAAPPEPSETGTAGTSTSSGTGTETTGTGTGTGTGTTDTGATGTSTTSTGTGATGSGTASDGAASGT